MSGIIIHFKTVSMVTDNLVKCDQVQFTGPRTRNRPHATISVKPGRPQPRGSPCVMIDVVRSSVSINLFLPAGRQHIATISANVSQLQMFINSKITSAVHSVNYNCSNGKLVTIKQNGDKYVASSVVMVQKFSLANHTHEMPH